MRFRLRTLLIVLALLPPVLAHAWATREVTLDAIRRASPEVPFQLLAFAVARMACRQFSKRNIGEIIPPYIDNRSAHRHKSRALLVERRDETPHMPRRVELRDHDHAHRSGVPADRAGRRP